MESIHSAEQNQHVAIEAFLLEQPNQHVANLAIEPLGIPLIAGQHFVQNGHSQCRMCSLKFYAFWSFAQMAIILFYFYVPKWTPWFVYAQLFNAISLVFALYFTVLSFISKEIHSMNFPGAWSLLALTFAYESVLAVSPLSAMYIIYMNFWPSFLIALIRLIDLFSTDLPYFGGIHILFWGTNNDYNSHPSTKKYCASGSIWFLLQIAIVFARIFVDQWAIWFEWVQGFHISSLIMLVVAIFIPNTHGKWHALTFVNVFHVIIWILAYNSFGGYVFQSVTFAAAYYYLWFWVLLVYRSFGKIEALQANSREKCLLCSLWMFVQISNFVFAFVVMPEWWFIWYVFLQTGMGVSFMFFILEKVAASTENIHLSSALRFVTGKNAFTSAANFLFLFSFISWFSTGVVLPSVSGIVAAHYWLWSVFPPYLGFALALSWMNGTDINGAFWLPSVRKKCVLYFFWLVVQTTIISAKILLSKWSPWFGFMQGFQILSLVLFIISKYAARTTEFVAAGFLLLLTFILSYNSILGFALSGSTLANALAWPWVLLISVMVFYRSTITAANFGFAANQ